MQCLCGCGQERTSKRSDTKFAGPACRIRYYRDPKNVTAAPQSVTDNPKSVTKPPQCVTDNQINTDTISPDQPCNVPVQLSGLLRIDDDLNLNLRRDLGITAWTPDGIFIRPDITIPQVQAIARLIHAKHGRPAPAFRSC